MIYINYCGLKQIKTKPNDFEVLLELSIFNQSEVAGLLVSDVAAVERQRRAGISAEEGFAQVCSRQSQAETTLQRGEGESRPVKRLEGYQG